MLSWALTQTSFFKEKRASSLAVKNQVSERIMTNQPALTPAQVVIPDIASIQPSAEDPVIAETPPREAVAAEAVTTTTEKPATKAVEKTVSVEPVIEPVIEPVEPVQPVEPSQQQKLVLRQKTGWIYAGQYKKGQWLKRALALPPNQLPTVGSTYQLAWGTNVRLAPPGKRKTEGSNLAKNIGYLAEKQEVEIIKLKNSGQTGHIWLEINY